MPWRIPAASRADEVALAAQHVLARDGVGGLTLRAIARQSQLSPASLTHQFGNLQHLVQVTAWRCALYRLEAIRDRLDDDGTCALLPDRLDGLPDARAWQAWVEVSRSHEGVATVVSNTRSWERAMLNDATGYRLRSEGLDTLAATADGLSMALTLAHRPLRLTEARARLSSLTMALLAEAPPGPEVTPQMRWLVRRSTFQL